MNRYPVEDGHLNMKTTCSAGIQASLFMLFFFLPKKSSLRRTSQFKPCGIFLNIVGNLPRNSSVFDYLPNNTKKNAETFSDNSDEFITYFRLLPHFAICSGFVSKVIWILKQENKIPKDNNHPQQFHFTNILSFCVVKATNWFEKGTWIYQK